MKKKLLVLMFMVIVTGGYILSDWYLRNIFTVIAVEEGTKLLSNCLDEALSQTITEEISYDDLIVIKEDETGNIVLVQNNTILMNMIAGKAAKAAEEKLNSNRINGIKVPVGYFFGGQLAAEVFPEVTIHFREIGNVTADFVSEFTEAGINQTKHTVNLSLNMDALLLIPNNHTNINVSISIPVCETVIIGNVPNEYRQYNDIYEDSDE